MNQIIKRFHSKKDFKMILFTLSILISFTVSTATGQTLCDISNDAKWRNCSQQIFNVESWAAQDVPPLPENASQIVSYCQVKYPSFLTCLNNLGGLCNPSSMVFQNLTVQMNKTCPILLLASKGFLCYQDVQNNQGFNATMNNCTNDQKTFHPESSNNQSCLEITEVIMCNSIAISMYNPACSNWKDVFSYFIVTQFDSTSKCSTAPIDPCKAKLRLIKTVCSGSKTIFNGKIWFLSCLFVFVTWFSNGMLNN